jgi:antirestriction protein ArdC
MVDSLDVPGSGDASTPLHTRSFSPWHLSAGLKRRWHWWVLHTIPSMPAGSRPAPARSPAEQKLVAALIALMEAGTTPWRRDWETSQGGHHRNLISGRRYRGANPVLLSLAMQARSAALPLWCGYAEAKAHGLTPRRGCSAAYVLRPQVHRRSGAPAANPLPESGDPPPGADHASADATRTWVSYRPLAVFNAADLVGDGLSALLEAQQRAALLAARPEPERLAGAEAVLGRWPVSLRSGAAHPCYAPGPDCIHMPERMAFHTAAGFYATWAHEAIHSTGHSSRLARDLSGGMGAAGDRGRAYAREELVAELGAVLLGDRLEIGSAMANHAAYLHGWITLLRESPTVLFQVLADARRAADLIAPEDGLQLELEPTAAPRQPS